VQDAAGHDRIRHLQVISTAAATASYLADLLLICKHRLSPKRETIISATDTQFSPSTRTFSDTMLQLLETAAEVTSASTNTYITVLNAIVEQQKLAQQASLEWLSGVISAESNVREQLIESYDSVKGELSETAEESTRLAGQLGAKVAKSSSNGVSSVSKKQSNAVTATARRPTPTTSNSAPS
jgi:hypothetical protein